MIGRERFKRLALREYAPLALTVALWATVVLILGHADAARLLAASVMIRAIQFLTRVSTTPSLRARAGAAKPIRQQAKKLARLAQGGCLLLALGLVGGLFKLLQALDQDQIATFLLLIAVGMPSRVIRFSDVKSDSPYYRLALAGGGLALALLAWAAGWHAVGIGLAFGIREWIALAVIRFWPKTKRLPASPRETPLDWPELARSSIISGRKLITYRLSKIALTVFGPIGNFAARTGRGMGWHARIEPYLPHRLSGFIAMSLATATGAFLLALKSGEPAAMIVAAGLLQLAGSSANIALLWRYLPDRADPGLLLEDEDDE
ncbi:hypothetical protein SH584_11090 [Sphingomonas sp. LY29]|uniref:hypothetical protein n=1 Tax=Sphingomonas sp. LY29 TaxID=3095341 RepID=UPI002D76CA9B|nr:hypothetical protein [Sphingomonas sp. LY29]WRP25576.1 hypothetical protein SH584_11090 [Sphingomonas sp. LY29]